MVHKLKAFPGASRRLLQGNNAMERVHFCMTIKNQFHHRFRVLKSPRCGSAPWWLEGLPARIESECTVNKTHPWVGEEQGPWQWAEARQNQDLFKLAYLSL